MKVIVAIDQTVYWKQVVQAVIERHWPHDTTFRVLTVMPALEWKDLDALESSEIFRELLKARQKTAEEILREARELLSKNIDDCSVHTELRQGSPRSEILDAAVEWMADKIMLGAHGHMPNRLFPGTVSRSVAQHAQCSVELIRLKLPSAFVEQDKRKQASTV
jgi:nucleotide-binding universal stress UspA family protein